MNPLLSYTVMAPDTDSRAHIYMTGNPLRSLNKGRAGVTNVSVMSVIILQGSREVLLSAAPSQETTALLSVLL